MLRIYHTSDIHNHSGFAAKLNALRTETPGVLVDCGDTLRGSQTVYRRSEPIIDEMNTARYDLGAPGNREFHYVHRLMTNRLEKMKRPLVCANLVDTFRRPLPFAKDYALAFDQRRMVRFFGMIVEQYPEGSPWENIFGWRFLNAFETARKVAESVSPDEILILLSHMGLEMDRRIAKAVPRINLILGGHSHDTLHEPEFVDGVAIVHAGPYAKYVSATDIAFETGETRARIVNSSLLPLLSEKDVR